MWGRNSPLFLGALATFLSVAGCGSEPIDPSDWELSDGGSLGDLPADDEPTAVFVLAPEDYPACQNVLASWWEWERTTGGELHVVLTREPSDDERRRLLVAGLRPDAVLADGGPRPGDTPAEFAIFDGGVVFEAYRVRTAPSPLLRRMGDGDLRVLTESNFIRDVEDPG